MITANPIEATPSPSPWVAQLARITAIRQDTADTASYDLQLENQKFATAYQFLPGQFNMLYLPGVGEAAISISSDPQKDTLTHTVRVAGNVTGALARLKVGDQIGVRGPFGSSWPVEECRKNDVVIASGGIGLAPLRPLIYHIINHRDDYAKVYVLCGARSPQELLYTDEYDHWRAAGIDVEVTVDIGTDDWTGHIGVVPVLFYRLRLNPDSTRVVTCGPEIMMRFVAFEALARRIDPKHIYLSMERNMGCAIGLCGKCQLGPSFVCKDGPVFSYEQMEPYLLLEDL